MILQTILENTLLTTLLTILSVVETSKEVEMYIVSVFNAAMTIIIMFGLTFFIDQAFAKKDRNNFN